MTKRAKGWRLLPLMALATGLIAAYCQPAVAGESPPVHWSSQLRSTAYFLEQAEPGSTTLEDRLPFYEQLDAGAGNLLDGKLDFRFSGRMADDARLDGAVDQDAKWFVGYAQLRLEPMQTRLRVGRQFIQEGAIFSTLDGGWVSVRPHRQLRVNAWLGSPSPYDRAFEFGDDARYGARATWLAHRQLTLGAWGSRWARNGETVAGQFGGEAVARPARTLKVLARGTYETEREEFERVDLIADWNPRPDWPVFRGQYLRRTQHYEMGSWWATFADELHDIQLLRGSARWTNERGVGGELQGFGSFVDESRNGSIGAAFLAPHLRVGLAYMSGHSGEQLRVYGDLDWSFARRFDMAAGATFAEYALVADPTDAQMRDLATYHVRAEVMIVPGVEFMTELQVLDNPVYSNDTRLLVGIDLMAGGGPSRIGLGSGGGH